MDTKDIIFYLIIVFYVINAVELPFNAESGYIELESKIYGHIINVLKCVKFFDIIYLILMFLSDAFHVLLCQGI